MAIVAPADYVVWTKKLENKIKSFESSKKTMVDVSAKELWLTGKMGNTDRTIFGNKGWKVTENANIFLTKK